jgi:hypothetical protein
MNLSEILELATVFINLLNIGRNKFSVQLIFYHLCILFSISTYIYIMARILEDLLITLYEEETILYTRDVG